MATLWAAHVDRDARTECDDDDGSVVAG